MSLFQITRVHLKAKCFMSGKETQAVEFTRSDDAPAIVGLNEFVKLLRLELRKVVHANRRRAAAKEESK